MKSPFDQQKRAILRALDTPDTTDRSIKGSLDAPIVGLIDLINRHANYVTTSSCSGRIVLFERVAGADSDNTDDNDGGGEPSKAGAGGWLLCEHARVSLQSVEEALARGGYARGDDDGRPLDGAQKLVWLRHEPFILHVQCRDVDSAQALYQAAREAGYREAGLSVGRRKIMVGIRTTSLCLVAPVAADGRVTVSSAHLGLMVNLCCDFFEQNERMVEKFERKLVDL